MRFRLFCVEMAVMQYSCLCYNYIKEDEKKAKRYKNSIKKIQKKRGIVYEEDEKKAKRYKNSIKKIQKKRGIVYEEEKFE